MNKKLCILAILGLVSFLPVALIAADTSQEPLTPMEELGKAIFFDTDLSSNGKMSCATCHAPETGFVGPDSDINASGAIYPGTIETRFGNRKPPTAAYGGESPALHYDESEMGWIGGMFWDGRATGDTLGDPLAEQAQGPFLNPLEHNMPSARLVCIRVAQSDYADLFEQVWGPGSLDFTTNIDQTYEYIARSIAAYERSSDVSPFSSKYDACLAGETVLSQQEAWGLELFEGKGQCSSCHLSEPGLEGEPPQLTNFGYYNLGMPRNEENPFYSMPERWNPDGDTWVDLGLGDFLQGAGYSPEVYQPELGKHKVPTLRNVDLRPYDAFVKAYGHNGYFKSLDEVVHFLNTRDAGSWPAPEYEQTINTDGLGNLRLSAEEEAAIVAFMKTLSDGYMP